MHLSLKLMGVARETEQGLRALAVDLGLGSSTHRQLTTVCYSRHNALFWPLWSEAYIWCTYTHTSKQTRTHIK